MRNSPHKSQCVGPSRRYTLLPGLRKPDITRCSTTSNLRIGKTCTSRSNERYFNDWPVGVEGLHILGRGSYTVHNLKHCFMLRDQFTTCSRRKKFCHFLPLFISSSHTLSQVPCSHPFPSPKHWLTSLLWEGRFGAGWLPYEGPALPHALLLYRSNLMQCFSLDFIVTAL